VKEHCVILFWSADDDCYVADIPDLCPGAAFGDTPERALAQVLAMKEAWFEAARDHGLEIPPAAWPP
jgi:predicted RNase H-like HicB family nuclease